MPDACSDVCSHTTLLRRVYNNNAAQLNMQQTMNQIKTPITPTTTTPYATATSTTSTTTALTSEFKSCPPGLVPQSDFNYCLSSSVTTSMNKVTQTVSMTT